ncbi:MAG: hypothetical protein K8R21_13070 [Leptospira sp.]|nr:hypothetical protein [Leptospira sp.]
MKPVFTYLCFTSFLFLLHCASEQKVQVDENFYKDCMQTVADKAKCDALVKKTEDREKEKEAQTVKLTEEQMQGLKLRSDVKSVLYGKSKLYVVNYLGEPDERSGGSTDLEYFIYRRPVARYSPEHDPDIEIIVQFRRGFVNRVNHTPPPTTPKTIMNVFGDRPREKKPESK